MYDEITIDSLVFMIKINLISKALDNRKLLKKFFVLFLHTNTGNQGLILQFRLSHFCLYLFYILWIKALNKGRCCDIINNESMKGEYYEALFKIAIRFGADCRSCIILTVCDGFDERRDFSEY